MIEIPVYLNEYVKDSTKRNGYNLVSELTTLTFSEALLERATAAHEALRELRKMRTRDHAPLTENQKWHSMVQAVRAYISSGEAIAQMDKFGRILLQNTEGSDSWYSVDRNVLDGYVENDDSTIPAGFRLHEQRARYPEGTP